MPLSCCSLRMMMDSARLCGSDGCEVVYAAAVVLEMVRRAGVDLILVDRPGWDSG
jgi:hypothetical protein